MKGVGTLTDGCQRDFSLARISIDFFFDTSTFFSWDLFHWFTVIALPPRSPRLFRAAPDFTRFWHVFSLPPVPATCNFFPLEGAGFPVMELLDRPPRFFGTPAIYANTRGCSFSGNSKERRPLFFSFQVLSAPFCFASQRFCLIIVDTSGFL